MSSGPDFIIIGAMKCATSTLHEQLARQPGVFMTTPKEPCFFSDDAIWERGLDWYRSLFDGASSHCLCGESSTHYTKLPTFPRTIDRIRQTLGEDVRLVYVMRHPISRLVSQYIHEWTQRVVSSDIDRAVRERAELVEYSRYAMQLQPYLEAFGRERVLPVFFECLTSRPQDELERVCRFIGYEHAAVWNDELEQQNTSSSRMRRSAWRDVLVDLPGVRQVRRSLVPQSVRDRVKRWWMMERRPEMSAETRARISEVFDEDLAQLGEWLGTDLCCETFVEQVQSVPTAWADRSEGVES